MEENVIISIKGSQLYEGQDPDVTELVTAGTLRREQDVYKRQVSLSDHLCRKAPSDGARASNRDVSR